MISYDKLRRAAVLSAVVLCYGFILSVLANPLPDNDGLPDWWELKYFGNDSQTESGDPDLDGLTNLQEYNLGTNPADHDTDYDGIGDGQEVLVGTQPTNVLSVTQVQLGAWHFNSNNCWGVQNQVPLYTANLALADGINGKAVSVHSNSAAMLKYREAEIGGHGNINCREGSVRFWFRPSWNSTNVNNGTGPQSEARLLDLGLKGNVTYGYWGLLIGSRGTNLYFCTQSNNTSVVKTNFSVPLSWKSNEWHQIVLTYSKTNSALYIDGKAVTTTGQGITNFPSLAGRTSGLRIGSDWYGANQARGRFDNLETYNYVLPGDVITNGYSTPCVAAVDVMLVVDRSSSMNTTDMGGGLSRLNAAKQAGSNFISHLSLTNDPGDKVGLVSFYSAGVLDMVLTNDGPVAIAKLYELPNNASGTRIDNGIPLATTELISARHRPDALKVMVVLSDGQNDGNELAVTNAANTAKFTNDIRLITVALSSSADTNLMRGIASSTNDYYFATNASQLDNAYNSIATTLCRLSNSPPTVSISSPTNNQNIYGPTNISILASAYDAEDGIVKVEFYAGTAKIGEDFHTPYAISWNAPLGTTNLTAVARDEFGLSTTSAVVSITVSASAPALTVQFIAPTNNQLFVFSPTNILLKATNTVGAITKMMFYNGSSPTPLGEATATPYQFLWTNVTAGNYTLKAVGTNSSTGVSATNTVSIVVNAMPVITNNAPTNIQAFNFIGSVNVGLTNTAWDPDGSVTNVIFYTWTNGGLTQVPGTVISNNLKWALMWNGLTNGYYSYYAVATDNRAAKSSSPIGVFKVNPTNAPPQVWITYPTNNEIFRAGADITITAAVALGAGTVTNVEFFTNGRVLGSDSNAPYSISECCWQPGTYTNVAKATDSYGATAYSTNVTMVVGPKVPTSGEGYWDSQFGLSIPPERVVFGASSYQALAISNHVSNGGSFIVASDYAVFEVLNGTNWTTAPFPWDQTSDGNGGELDLVPYSTIMTYGTNLYAFGPTNLDFPLDTDPEGHTNYRLIKRVGSSYVTLGDELSVESPDTPSIQGILEIAGELYVCGYFTSAGSPSDPDTDVQYVAKLDVSNNRWIPVGNGLNGVVDAMAAIGNVLYIGGAFTNAGGNSNANYIARLCPDNTWTNLGAGVALAPQPPDAVVFGDIIPVRTLTACGTNLFVGGQFTTAGDDTNVNGIAIWNTVQWRGMNGGPGTKTEYYDPPGLGNFSNWPPVTVYSISVYGNQVYVGGDFTYVVNGYQQDWVTVSIDGTGSRWERSLLSTGTNQVVFAQGIAQASWSELDQTWRWSSLDSGVGDAYWPTVKSTLIVPAESPNSYDLIVAGDFGIAGTHIDSPNIARWRVGYPPPVQPFITITNPVNLAVFTNSSEPFAITITATASSNISYVEFFVDGASVGAVGGDLDSYTTNWPGESWSEPTNGVHTLRAVAADNDGLKSESKPVLINIKGTNAFAFDDVFVFSEGSSAVALPVTTNDVAGVRISRVDQLSSNLGRATAGHDCTYISYMPSTKTTGTDRFIYTVTNSLGLADSAWVTVNLRAKPTVEITTPSDLARFKTNISIAITNTSRDWDGTVTNVALFVNGDFYKNLATNSAAAWSYTTNWLTNAIGFYTLETVATDNEGYTNISAPIIVILTNILGGTTPTAIIANLVITNNSQFDIESFDLPKIRDGLFELIGTATGDSPVGYQVLLYRPDDWESIDDLSNLVGNIDPYANITPSSSNNYQGFRTNSVVNGSLGELNLTDIPNGIYDLVLRVRGGSEETNAIVRVMIESNLKIGQFSFSEQDLVLPVNGIPLTVTRTYNSLNPRSAEFGYGWTYALNSMDVEIDEERTTVTALDTLDDADLPVVNPMSFSMRTGGGRNVTLTLPDGRRTTFQFTYAKTTSAEDCPSCYDGEWIAPPGVTATLTTLDPATKHSTGDDTVIALFSPLQPYWQAGGSFTPLEAYDIPTLVLTTDDGTKYFITRDADGQEQPTYIYQDEAGLLGDAYKTYYIKPHPGTPKLTKIVQRTGDEIRISDTGVEHFAPGASMADRSIFMQRDGAGRITDIFDPNSGVTNQETALNAKALVKYVYNRDTGNLIQVHRLQDRANGNYLVTKYHYDHPKFPHYITSIEDPRGIPLARNEYDDSGRLTAVVDADGKRTEFGHDTNGKFERVIDRLNNTNTFVYDTKGNVTFTTNAVGIVTAMGYGDPNFSSAETAVTNALGTAQMTWSLFSYDAKGNKTNVVTSPNHTNSFRYDQFGNLLWQRDAAGNVTTNGYDSFGNLTNTVQLDANNVVVAKSSSIYANGHLVETRNINNEVTASFSYDSMGNLTSTTDANGVSRGFGYDANGNQTNSWNAALSVTNRTIYDAQGRVTASIDALGNTNRTFYNALGTVDYTVDKFGNTNSFLYDTRGNLIQTTHADGLKTQTVYDDAGRAYLTTDRNGITGTRTYFDAAGRATNVVRLTNVVVSIQAGPSAIISNAGTPISTNATEYFPNGWVKKRVGPDNQPTTYAYWPDGQTMYVTNALNQTTFYKYDEAGRQEYVADALNRTNRFEYDAAGRMFKTVFHNGTYTSNYFNNLGQRTVVRDQGGLLTQFGYDISGQLTNVIKPQVIDGITGSPATPEWTYKYDAYGRQTETIDPMVHSTTNSYDQFGREVSRWLPMGGPGTTNYYNALGQLTNQVDFKNQRKQTRYDRFGRVGTNYYFATPASTYPSNTVVYLYNHLGQLMNITERSGTDASTGYVAALGMPGGKTGRYAAMLAFVNRIPPGAQGGLLGGLLCGLAAMAFFTAEARRRRVRTWELARTVLTTIRAYTFSLSAGGEGRGEVARYATQIQFRSLPSSILHLPSSWIAALIALCSFAIYVLRCGGTPDGTPKRFRLPSFGWRLVTILTLAALIGSDPRFDALWTARAACTDPGNSNVSPTIRITEFSYDVEGRLAQVNSPEGYINYNYDLATGRHLGTCTKNSETTYEYDALGRLWKVHAIKRNGSTINETTTYTYTAVGSRESVSLPNGVVTTWQYDELNRLTNMANVKTSGNELLSQFSYKLDLSGRRTNAVEILKQESGSPAYQTNTLSWAYDGLYRLTNEVCVAMVPSASYTNRFQYDKTGNRWSNVRITSSGTTTVTNQYNANDQLLKEVTLSGTTPITTNSYAYDANGSLLARTNVPTSGTGSTNLYSYDLKNKLSQVASFGGIWTTNSFLYNEQGIRVRTTPNSGSPTLYLVDGNNHTGYAQVLEELSALGGPASRSYMLGDDVLGQANGSSAGSYLLYDGHGSTRQLADNTGAVTSRYNYDAHGTTLTATSSSAAETSLLYCGEQYDSALNMYNLRARFYDPSNGRFNAMDTFRGNNQDPQSLHKYAYCHGDSVNMIDPRGESALYVAIAILVAVVLLVAVTWYVGNLYSQARSHKASLYSPSGPGTTPDPFAEMSGPFKIKICANNSHSWIVVTHVQTGIKHSYGRWARGYGNSTNSGGGVRVDDKDELKLTPTASRTATIKVFSVTMDQGYDEWWSNCSTFARETWEKNTDEDIDSDTWIGIDTPGISAVSIRRANNGKDHYEIPTK